MFYRKQRGAGSGIAGLLLVLGFIAVAVWGWFVNLSTVWNADINHLTVKLVVQFIGIFVPPLGSILGLFF